MKKNHLKFLGFAFIFILGLAFFIPSFSHGKSSANAAGTKTYEYIISNGATSGTVSVSGTYDDNSTYPLLHNGTDAEMTSIADAIALIETDTSGLNYSETAVIVHFDNYTLIDDDVAMNFSIFNSDPANSKFQISGTIFAPHYFQDKVIIENIKLSDCKSISINPLNNLYSVTKRYSESTYKIYDVKIYLNIKVNFDSNNGTFKNQPINVLSYYSESTLFPASTDIARQYYTFAGWVGKLTIDETASSTYGIPMGDWFYDKNTLREFIIDYQENSDISEIKNYFKDDISKFDIISSLTEYSYSKDSLLSAVVLIPLDIFGQTPTFVAAWNIDTYTLSFNTDGGFPEQQKVVTHLDDISGDFLPIPTKTGYTFDDWYTTNKKTEKFTATHITNDTTIYAKWIINQYTLTTQLDDGTEYEVITQDFKTNITLTAPTKTGHSFSHWERIDTNQRYTISTMPSENVTIKAVFTVNSYNAIFQVNGGTSVDTQSVVFGEKVIKPTDPQKKGHSFAGWHSDSNCINDFDFQNYTMEAKNITIFADWRINEYNISFYLDQNSSTAYERKRIEYDKPITLPENPTKNGFKFANWVNFDGDEIFNISRMPDFEIEVYASWTAKETITINEKPQSYNIKNTYIAFKEFSEIDGFIVEYKVDGMWQTEAPKNAGKYDVKITKAEDADYCSFSKVIKNGLEITPEVVDYTWLIVVLFIVGILEISVSILLRIFRKVKLNAVISFSPIPLMLANRIMPTSQIVLIVVSGVFALFGFVLMVYQMVKLHRTMPISYDELHKKDEENEEHLVVPNDISAETKTFSAEDIEAMLSDSDYFEKHDARKKVLKQTKPTTETPDFSTETGDQDKE